jgi:hypothetical protein
MPEVRRPFEQTFQSFADLAFQSPWWLLGKGNEAKAAHALRKLGYTPDGIEKRMAAMVLTLQEVSVPNHTSKRLKDTVLTYNQTGAENNKRCFLPRMFPQIKSATDRHSYCTILYPDTVRDILRI